VRRLVLPLLRADFAMLESYLGPEADAPPLPCPLAVLAGRGDPRYMPVQVSAWVEEAPRQEGGGKGGSGGGGDEAAYQEAWFEGTHK
jgi:hypothetical protein